MELNNEQRQLIKEIISNKCPVFLSCANLPVTFQSICLHLASNYLLIKNTVPYVHINKFMTANSFELQVGLFKFQANSIESDGKDIIFSILKSTKFPETRQEARLLMAKNDEVECELLNPFDQMTLLRKKVIEMSNSGLSLALNFDSKLFEKGIKLGSIKIIKNKKIEREGHAEVVYKRQLINDKGQLIYQAGIKFIG